MTQLAEARQRLTEAQAKVDHASASMGEAQRIIAECRLQAKHLDGDVAGEIENNVRMEQAQSALSRLERERHVQQQLVGIAQEHVTRLELQAGHIESEITDSELALLPWLANRRGERLQAACDELQTLTNELMGAGVGQAASKLRDVTTTARSVLANYAGTKQRLDKAKVLQAKVGQLEG